MRRPRRLLLLVVAPRRARADRRAIIIVDGPARVGMVVFLLVRSDRRDIPPGRRATDGRGGRDLGLRGGGGAAPRPASIPGAAKVAVVVAPAPVRASDTARRSRDNPS